MTLETYEVDTFPVRIKRRLPSEEPRDLTGATVTAVAVRLQDTSDKIDLTVSIEDGPNGVILLWIPPQVLKPEPYYIQVVVTKDGEVKTFQMVLIVHKSFGP